LEDWDLKGKRSKLGIAAGHDFCMATRIENIMRVSSEFLNQSEGASKTLSSTPIIDVLGDFITLAKTAPVDATRLLPLILKIFRKFEAPRQQHCFRITRELVHGIVSLTSSIGKDCY
jgi:hypothetical protein